LVEWDDDGTKTKIASNALRVADVNCSFIPEGIRPAVPTNLPRNPRDHSMNDDLDENRSSSDSSAPSYFEDSDVDSNPSNPSTSFDPATEEAITYSQRVAKGNYELSKLVGEKVRLQTPQGRDHDRITWTVIKDHKPTKAPSVRTPGSCGLKKFDWMEGSDGTVVARLFLFFMFPDLLETWHRYNRCVTELNQFASKNHQFNYVDVPFILTCLACMLVSTCYGVKGERMWKASSHCTDEDKNGFVKHPELDQYVPLYKFQQFKK
jgi:hypothetical protein